MSYGKIPNIVDKLPIGKRKDAKSFIWSLLLRHEDFISDKISTIAFSFLVWQEI